MPRNMRIVEAGMLAVLLSGLSACATEWDPKPDDLPRPDGLDYVRAVHCGGLIWAMQVASVGPSKAVWPELAAKEYQRWAELIAWDTKLNPKLALSDMTTMRDTFLHEAYRGSTGDTEQNLRAAYPGDLRACESAVESAYHDIVIIGG